MAAEGIRRRSRCPSRGVATLSARRRVSVGQPRDWWHGRIRTALEPLLAGDASKAGTAARQGDVRSFCGNGIHFQFDSRPRPDCRLHATIQNLLGFWGPEIFFCGVACSFHTWSLGIGSYIAQKSCDWVIHAREGHLLREMQCTVHSRHLREAMLPITSQPAYGYSAPRRGAVQW